MIGYRLGVVALSGLLLASPVFAANAASDSASNYSGGDFSGQNLGSGFGAWSITQNNNDYAGDFINNPDFAGGSSWDLYCGDLSTNTAYRPFTGGSLSIGQTLTVSNEILRNQDGGGNGGIELTDSTGAPLLRVYSVGGTNNYFVDDALGNAQTIPGSSYNYQSADSFTVTLNDALGDYTLTMSGNSTATYTGQYSVASGGASEFGFYDLHGGSFSDVDVEGISLSAAPAATPEPTSLILVGTGSLGLLSRRRRTGV